ncbi:uncharacterized protein N7500_007560, partial [Penicillium coprophilum]|uniref:uncharacterized protein n=1 Tax=Penicillium coprophilum TaxID=36646 RepID=UPI00238DBA29
FAWAFYSKEPAIILDGALIGLDRETKKVILESLFAEHGFIKHSRQNVIMEINSAYRLLYAKNVIALDEDRRIIQHGSSSDLMSSAG